MPTARCGCFLGWAKLLPAGRSDFVWRPYFFLAAFFLAAGFFLAGFLAAFFAAFAISTPPKKVWD